MTKQKKDWGPNRLGNVRRNLSKYSYEIRSIAGLNANHRQIIKDKRKIVRKMLILHLLYKRRSKKLNIDQHSIERFSRLSKKLLQICAIKTITIRSMLVPRVPIPRSIDKSGKMMSIDLFRDNDVECAHNFHYTADELDRIINCLKLPEFFTLNSNNNIKSHHKISGEYCLLFMLYNYKHPKQTMREHAPMWGYHDTVLSKIWTTVLLWMHDNHCHRLVQLNKQNTILTSERLTYFNRKFVSKLNEKFPNEENGLPPEAHGTCLLLDEIRVPIARPKAKNGVNIQKSHYTIHKHTHTHGVQGVIDLTGMFVDVYSGPLGRFPDMTWLTDSDLNYRFAMHLILVGIMTIIYCIYCDKGYKNMTHIRCAHHGIIVTALQKRHNRIMQSGRIPVEWGFGRMYALCPLLRKKIYLKIQAVDVDTIVKVAMLLTNINVCMQGSQVSEYFDTTRFTLEQYFE